MTRRRVVVTGMGVVAPNGVGLDAFDAALRAGRSGIRHVPRLAERLSGSRIAGLNWLMLSRPEKASHEPAKPTRNVVGVSADPSLRWSSTNCQCGGPMCHFSCDRRQAAHRPAIQGSYRPCRED